MECYLLIDINDYKKGLSLNVRKIKYYYLFFTIIFIIGLLIINNKIKYYEYYDVSLECKENLYSLYVPVNDIKKITKNNKIKIDNRIFAYTINSISEENIYSNGMYYKIIKLSINDYSFKENNIINSKIIISKDTLIGYVFKTVWR